MDQCIEHPEVLAFADNVELLEKLKQACSLLDVIQSGLNSYLEKKRLFFPRFFFLSNDEMLEILSETKDPLRVQPHLCKCFEGIKSLNFQISLDICGMISAEGEKVMFPYDKINEPHTINPLSTGGQVEVWLKDVERVMRKSVAQTLDVALVDYAGAERTKWILEWPGQIVLCVTQLIWTKHVTEAIQQHGVSGIKSEVSVCNAQIDAIVRLVRGKLTKLERKTISPLVVLDVHARDVLLDLVHERVQSVSDFGWQSQLRYYYNADGQ